jgi:GNAT superfamily N-acetyltransferase
MQLSRFHFERITEGHMIDAFDCGNTAINMYLRDGALSETQENFALTTLLIDYKPDTPTVAGFFALRAHFYYDPTGPRDHIPVVELCYLARHKSYRGQGIGGLLLIEVFQRVKVASELIGLMGMHLHSTPEGRKLYTRYKFGEHPNNWGMYEKFLFVHIDDIRQIVSSITEGE